MSEEHGSYEVSQDGEAGLEAASAVAQAEALLSSPERGHATSFLVVPVPYSGASVHMGVYREPPIGEPVNYIFEIYGGNGDFLVGMKEGGEIEFGADYDQNEAVGAWWGAVADTLGSALPPEDDADPGDAGDIPPEGDAPQEQSQEFPWQSGAYVDDPDAGEAAASIDQWLTPPADEPLPGGDDDDAFLNSLIADDGSGDEGRPQQENPTQLPF